MGGEAGDGVDLIEDDFPGRGEKRLYTISNNDFTNLDTNMVIYP